LNESCTDDDRELWKRGIDDILEKRITDPGIMDDFLSVETGIVIISLSGIHFDRRHTEPKRAELELEMLKEETASTQVPGRTKWIIEGIKLQEEQYVVFLCRFHQPC
jgi:hypothetical protein